TIYDMRRCQDSINLHIPDHANVMVLASGTDENSHPYWYARILGIFHVMARHNKGQPQRFDFLWVCWYGLDEKWKFGAKSKRMPRVEFIRSSDDCAFGFIDPACVIQAVHLIPAFALGTTKEFLGHSVARQECENDEDWYRFYVGIFVNRDMFIRYMPNMGLQAQQYSRQNQADDSEDWTATPEGQGNIEDDFDSNREDLDILLPSQEALDEPPVGEDEEVGSAVDSDEEVDYGYEERDRGCECNSEVGEDDMMEEFDARLGAEDGEEYLDYNTALHETEGYAHL
ncbi:hypothetical protein K435DRAFT_665829, partial [Dendrothele bispora CBS 962.96]